METSKPPPRPAPDRPRPDRAPQDRAPPDRPPEAGSPAPARPAEIGGRTGPDPTRYGDWELNGRCIDF